MYDNSNINTLLRKLVDKSISNEELQILHQWSETDSNYAKLLHNIENESLPLEDINIWLELRDGKSNWLAELQSNTIHKINTSKKIKIFKNNYMNIAAAIFFLFGLSFVSYKYIFTSDSPTVIEDLKPGTNKARITLSDGKIIDLREDQEGIVFGEKLNYVDGTLIEDLDKDKLTYAILETPKGGQYHIKLSDGTQVWLNADSKLKYPVVFNEKERIVELEGEAYFDVKNLSTKKTEIPFTVKTSYQNIKVLGTQFNVNAYKLDRSSPEKTTLVEGKIVIGNTNDEVVLEPGYQGVISSHAILKKKVDVTAFTAWVDNKFIFDDTDLREVLEVLGRWYDFEYIVENPNYNVQLYANISRSKNFKEVLEILRKSEIKFRLENNRNENKLIIIN